VQVFLVNCRTIVDLLAQSVSGRNEDAPSPQQRSYLTFARQAIGWSGKHMERQLREARSWRTGERRQLAAAPDDIVELYPGSFEDPPHLRPIIKDFFDNARWSSHGRFKDRSQPGFALRMVDGGGQWPSSGIYSDRIGAARHFVRMFPGQVNGRPAWRQHVVANL
jgi:hypothetical protein